jgi:hypothetical protein
MEIYKKDITEHLVLSSLVDDIQRTEGNVGVSTEKGQADSIETFNHKTRGDGDSGLP